MKRLLAALLLVAAPMLAQTPTPTATPSPTPTRTPTPTVTPTMTRTPTPVIPSRYSLAQQVRPGFGTFSTETTANKLGDTYYATDYQSFGKVAGNITTTRKWFRQTGTGAISAAPAWDTLVSGDIPNNAANTTGSAAKWTTARLLAGNSVDGSANAAFANAFIVKGTADSGLSGAQFLGALGTGILKNTTTTGTLSIAAGSDLPPLLSVKGDLLAYSSSQGVLGVGVNGLCLVTDSTATFGFKWDSCATGAGTVTSIATTAPITGGTITATGTIAISSFASTAPLPGAVPDATGAGAGTYLDKSGNWTTPSGTGATSPLTTKGDLWGYSTGDTRVGVGTDGQVLTADSTNANGVSYQTIGGAPPGMYLHPDPNFTVPASYERLNFPMGIATGFIQLKPARTFSVTHANAIASTTTAESWTSRNTSNWTSADTNTTLANALHIVHNTSSTDDLFNTTDTGGNFYRASVEGTYAYEAVARFKIGTTQTGFAIGLVIQDANDLTKYWARITVHSGTPVVVFGYNINGTAAEPTSAALTAQQLNTDGIWIRIVRVGVDVTTYYSTAVQATPPTTWTLLDRKLTVFKSGGEQFRTALYAYRFSASCTVGCNADFMYLDEHLIPDPFSPTPGDTGLGAAGFDSSGPALTLIASADLGSAGATVADADVRSAVTEVQNQRFFDAGAWTYSAVRGSSASPAASTYQAAGSITVGGSGRYFALYGKCTSTSRVQPCSLNAGTLRLPFIPAAAGLGNLTGSGTADRVAYWGSSSAVSADSSFAWDSTNHRLGIGTTAPDAPVTIHANATAPLAPTAGTLLHLAQVDGTSSRLGVDAFAAAPAIEFRRADTSSAAASAVQSGETIGNVGAKGYGATGFPSSVRAQQLYAADQTWTDSNQGTRVTWGTTANNTTTLSERMRLDNAGSLYLAEGTGTTSAAQVGGTLFTQTADVTVANSVAETTLIGSGVGSATLPANLLTAGRTLRATAGGKITGTTTVLLKLKYGSTVIAQTSTTSEAFISSPAAWRADVNCTTRTTGATGTIMCSGVATFETGTSPTLSFSSGSFAAVTLDTTASSALSITMTWGATGVGNSITAQNVVFEVLN